jgi:glucose-1-phosphate adenylyltransferase
MGADYFESQAELAQNVTLGNPPIGIGHDCEIRNAIIDKNARIGNGVKLINARSVRDEQAENYVIVSGIIVVPKNGIIPDGTVI